MRHLHSVTIALAIVYVLATTAQAADSQVEPFDYKLTMRARPISKRPAIISTKTFVLDFSAESVKRAPAEGCDRHFKNVAPGRNVGARIP